MPPRMAAAWRPVSIPSPAASTTARRTVGSPMNRASRPIAFEPPPTHATATSGSRPSTLDELRRGLVADPPLEVAHDRRVRMRAHRRAQHVVGGLDVGDPVAHRLVDRVLERGRPGRDRADLRAERAHPQDVGALAFDVLGAHVHDARQVEQGAGRRCRDPVLAGAGLGDDPGLAQSPGEQRLAERVVDLVGARVGEVLALQVQPEVRDPGLGGPPALGRGTGQSRGLGADGRGQAIGPVDAASAGRRTARAARAAPPRRPGRGGARRTPSRAARARPSASPARTGRRSRAPSPSARRRRRRAGRRATGVGPNGVFGRSSRAARARLTNSATRIRVLDRALARARAGTRRPTRRRRRPRGSSRSASRDVRRVEAAGQGDRHLPGDRGGQGASTRAGRSRPDAGRRPCRAGAARPRPRGTPARARRAATRRRRRRPAARPAGGGPSRPAGRSPRPRRRARRR